ncbi:MAG TPA: terminase family protein [Ktedonobacterales bacterium]
MSASGDERGDTLRLQWKLNPAQWAFVHSDARFSFYVGGIGAGKTFAGAARSIVRAMEDPGSLGLIGAPTFPMLRDATQRTFLGLLPRELIKVYARAEERLLLVNGSEILFRSLDTPDRARGLNLAWFWLDEAPLCGYYSWQVLKGRLRQAGRHTAAWATGTPRGHDGFARDFEARPARGHTLVRAATWTNAHNLPLDYIASLGYTGAFAQQEIEGQFVAFEGLVYAFDPTPGAHVRDPEERSATGWARVVGGVDWGYTHPTAGLVFGVDGDGLHWQLDEFYQRRASLDETVLPALVEMTRRWSVAEWFCGPDEPEHIAALSAALARAGLSARVTRAENSVRAGIQTVASLLARRPDGQPGLVVAPRCVHTRAEYRQYQWAAATGERDPAEQPLKQRDDAMDATRYALHSERVRNRAADRTNAWLTGLRRDAPERP